MYSRLFLSLQTAIKRLVLFSIGAVLFLGLMQPMAQAAPSSADVPTLSTESLEQKRAERRAAQSEASKAANSEEEADSIGEVFADKLNLEEIVEENVIVNDDFDVLDADSPVNR